MGKRILVLRKKRGMTQNDLAFESGLGREYISTVECGKRNISIDAIEKISAALKLSLKELFDFEEGQFTPPPIKLNKIKYLSLIFQKTFGTDVELCYLTHLTYI